MSISYYIHITYFLPEMPSFYFYVIPYLSIFISQTSTFSSPNKIDFVLKKNLFLRYIRLLYFFLTTKKMTHYFLKPLFVINLMNIHDMVDIYGATEIGAHLRINFFYLISLRRLTRSRAVADRFDFSEKTYFLSCVRN